MMNYHEVICRKDFQQYYYSTYLKPQLFLAPMFQYQVLVQTLDPCEEYADKVMKVPALDLNTFLQILANSVFFVQLRYNHN
jgi:hypothetical protein